MRVGLSLLALGVMAALPVLGSAFQDDLPPSKLPIDVPKNALVTFEADGPGKKFLPIIKHLLSGDLTDPSAPPKDKIKVKTQFGDIDISIDQIAPLLQDVHYLHVVTYTALPGEDPFKRQEKFLTMAGLQKVGQVPGSDGVLVMRHEGKTEQYGIVVKNKGTVAILRSDGGPGLGDIGKMAYETLARLVQQAAQGRKR